MSKFTVSTSLNLYCFIGLTFAWSEITGYMISWARESKHEI